MATLPQQRKEQTRAKILDAAAVVFARRGYEAAKVEEITVECGIAKGALYGHFASKEDLFQTILLEQVNRRISETAAQLAPGLSFRESILCILDASWSSCRTDPTWSPLFAEFWALSSRSAWARDAAATLFDHCASALGLFLSDAKRQGLVRADLDVDRTCRLLLALNDGLVVQWQAQPASVDPGQFHEAMADMICAYVENQHGAPPSPRKRAGSPTPARRAARS